MNIIKLLALVILITSLTSCSDTSKDRDTLTNEESMKLNNDVIVGNWKQIKGDIQKKWGKLTDSELEEAKGNAKKIEGLIQERYGKSKDSYADQLSAIFEKY